MNWLSQMINTQIDLRKMYPANIEYVPKGNPDALIKVNQARGIKAREDILKALGDERIGSTELFYRLGKVRGGAGGRMLRMMVDEGLIVMTRNANRVYWEAVK